MTLIGDRTATESVPRSGPDQDELARTLLHRLRDEPPQLHIAGEAIDATTAQTTDPSTGQVLTAVPVAEATTVNRAVAAGLRAQGEWHALGVSGRRVALEAFGRAVATHLDELAMLDSIDGGNPYAAMVADIRRVLHQFATWPAVASMTGGDTIPIDPRDLHFTEYAPFGVVARIVAYNHPAYFAIKSVLPPLTMGNSVVLKAAEQTPLSALRIGELADQTLPPGVLCVIAGGREAGDALVRHPEVRRVGFTGSMATGTAIQRSAAEVGVKNVSLELGGKNAMLVFPDAPAAAVADAIIAGMNLGSCAGQSCGSTSRVFVHRAIHDDVVEAARARLTEVRPGVAYARGTAIGPLVSEEHRDRVAGFVRKGNSDGARMVLGNGVPTDLPPGYYQTPVLFDRVEQSMQIAREEIFGPIISMLAWDDLDTALLQINSVQYGLTGAIWTNDLDRALYAARGMHTGYVWVNDVGKHFWGMPFGGVKDSGVGREECLDELRSYGEIKAINMRTRWS